MSAWNDNGKAGLINETAPELLYRTDFFGGLGWMLTKWDFDQCDIKDSMMRTCDRKHDCFMLICKLQGALDGVDGEMASELLGRLDERTSSKKRFVLFKTSTNITNLTGWESLLKEKVCFYTNLQQNIIIGCHHLKKDEGTKNINILSFHVVWSKFFNVFLNFGIP